MPADQDLSRNVLPIPDPHQPYPGLITYDAKDPATTFPPIRADPAARGRAERPHRPHRRHGLRRVERVRRTDRDADGRTARGRRAEVQPLPHDRAVLADAPGDADRAQPSLASGMGGITEIATSAPGYSGVRPNTAAPLAEILKLQRLLDGAVREVPRGAGVRDEPDGSVRPVADREWRSSTSTGSSAARRTSTTRRSTRARCRSNRDRTPEEGYHFTEDMTDRAIDLGAPAEGAHARPAVLHVLRARGHARAAPGPDGVDREVPRAASTRGGTRCARRRSPARSSSASSRRTRS